MTIYEYMEDYDNAELSTEDWTEQMAEAVEKFYLENPNAYKMKPANAIRNYFGWKREKSFGDQ